MCERNCASCQLKRFRQTAFIGPNEQTVPTMTVCFPKTDVSEAGGTRGFTKAFNSKFTQDESHRPILVELDPTDSCDNPSSFKKK